MVANFARLYSELYSSLNPDFDMEALNWRVRASGPARELRVKPPAQTGRRDPTDRPVYFPDVGFVITPVFKHAELAPGTGIEGPAIVEQRESTAVVGVGDTARVDTELNLIINVGGSIA